MIDGITEKNYHSDNAVVKAIHSSFPKIMGGLHNRLLELEAKHMAFQMTQGIAHGRKLTVLADAFGIKGFELDDESWLRKERTILARLRAKPFFQIKEIIVWEKEGLSERALRGSRLAQNLRFNPDSLIWERRVLTEWEVAIRNKKKLKINKTSVSFAKSRLGEPALILGNQEPIFIYSSQVTNRILFFEPKVISRDVLVLYFNKKKKLKKVEKFNLKDGKSFQMNTDTTDLSADQRSLIATFFSNIGIGSVRLPD